MTVLEVEQWMQATDVTMRQVLDNLTKNYPGRKAHRYDGGKIIPGMAIVVDGHATSLGSLQCVRVDSDIHFLPTTRGGSAITTGKQGQSVFLS